MTGTKDERVSIASGGDKLSGANKAPVLKIAGTRNFVWARMLDAMIQHHVPRRARRRTAWPAEKLEECFAASGRYTIRTEELTILGEEVRALLEALIVKEVAVRGNRPANAVVVALKRHTGIVGHSPDSTPASRKMLGDQITFEVAASGAPGASSTVIARERSGLTIGPWPDGCAAEKSRLTQVDRLLTRAGTVRSLSDQVTGTDRLLESAVCAAGTFMLGAPRRLFIPRLLVSLHWARPGPTLSSPNVPTCSFTPSVDRVAATATRSARQLGPCPRLHLTEVLPS